MLIIFCSFILVNNPTLPRNVELKLKVNSFSIEIENESGVISIYTFDPRQIRDIIYY